MDFKGNIKYIISIVITIIVLLFCICFVWAIKQIKNSSIYYKQGLEYYNKEDFQNAYFNFSKILPPSDLFLNAIFKQAKCADLLGDNKTALKKYSLLEKFAKDQNIIAFALWRKGNIYYKNNETKQARHNFLKLNKQPTNTEYKIASNYMLAALSDNVEDKKAYLIEYIKNSPTGKFALDSAKELLNYDLEDKERNIIAECFYKNEKYRETISVLENMKPENSFVYLILAYDKLHLANPIKDIPPSALTFENADFNKDDLEKALDIYFKNNLNSNQTTLLVYRTAQNPDVRAFALYKNIELTPAKEQVAKKTKLIKEFPNTKYTQNTIYDLFVNALKNKKDKYILQYGDYYIKHYEDRKTTPSVLYFVAKTKKENSNLEYKENLKILFEKYPNSYYSYLGYKNFVNPNLKKFTKIKPPQKISFPKEEIKNNQKFYENFVKTNDIKAFDDFRINNPIILSYLEYKKHNPALSSVIARDYIQNSDPLPKRSNLIWQLAYPIYYKDEINQNAHLNNLDSYLILSLIKEESHFNENIISEAGAVGLGQILPSSASMMAGRNVSLEELKNKNINIELSTKYFAYIKKELAKDEMAAVLAYNAGPNAVKNWLLANENSDFDVMVEKIPYLETKNYIKKIYGSYWNYLLTYTNIKI